MKLVRISQCRSHGVDDSGRDNDRVGKAEMMAIEDPFCGA
jgi:hypothetical protein